MVGGGAAWAADVVKVATHKELGPVTMVIGTNAGPVSLRESTDYSEQYRELGITAVRIHDYYGPGDWYTMFPNWDADPTDPASYDFESTDRIVSKLVDEGFEVLFRLGPSWSARDRPHHNDPPGTIRDSRGQVTHAASQAEFAKFATVCTHIVKHYNEGWANGYQYGIRQWEIWNEPSVRRQFWAGSPEQFQSMFIEVAKALKAHDPSLVVGGPGLAGRGNAVYSEGLISRCQAESVPLDFYSWHYYGGGRGGQMPPEEFGRRARAHRKMLDDHGYPNAANVCGEWNANTRHLNFSDTGRGAAFYVAVLVEMLNAGVTETYQYRADRHPLGLMRVQGGLKTAGHALVAWKNHVTGAMRVQVDMKGGEELWAIATRTSDGSGVDVIVSNLAGNEREVRLEFDGLPALEDGEWAMTHWRISDSEAYSVVGEETAKPQKGIRLTMAAESVDVIRLRGAVGEPSQVQTEPVEPQTEQAAPEPESESFEVKPSYIILGIVCLTLIVVPSGWALFR